MRFSAPVMASKPVAKTITSRSKSPCSVRMPVGVISSIPPFAQVDERDVVAVERLEVVDVEHRPLAADRVATGRQLLGHLGVVHRAADHLPEQLGTWLRWRRGRRPRRPTRRAPQKPSSSSTASRSSRRRSRIFRSGRLRRPERPAEAGDAGEGLALLAPELVGILLEGFRCSSWSIMPRNGRKGVGGRALEHVEVLGLARRSRASTARPTNRCRSARPAGR